MQWVKISLCAHMVKLNQAIFFLHNTLVLALVGCEGGGNSRQNTLHVALYWILYYRRLGNLLSQNNIATYVCTRAIRSLSRQQSARLA